MKIFRSLSICIFALAMGNFAQAQSTSGFTDLKADMASAVDSMSKLTQVIVDSLFSFSELGFQEFQTQAYLTGILAENGFDIELGVAGIPSSWWASWGSGSPVIALGSDVDGIPRASQMPGVAFASP
jgi:aminobenzoyl-glutamate utilization protein B